MLFERERTSARHGIIYLVYLLQILQVLSHKSVVSVVPRDAVAQELSRSQNNVDMELKKSFDHARVPSFAKCHTERAHTFTLTYAREVCGSLYARGAPARLSLPVPFFNSCFQLTALEVRIIYVAGGRNSRLEVKPMCVYSQWFIRDRQLTYTSMLYDGDKMPPYPVVTHK